jgi:hypothetical protein
MSEDLVVGEENLKEGEAVEQIEEVEFELTSDLEYIQAAYFALAAIESLDLDLMEARNKQDGIRIRRIRRKALVIVDECLKSLYDEIIEETKEEES